MNEKVTVYILTYNRPDYLIQCLDSLRGQTYSNFKTVILDNCSEVKLDFIISKYSDLNIEYIRHGSNLGSTGNLIFAWNHPKDTEYFVLFHDDDLMHPVFLEKEFEILELNPDVSWVASDSKSFKGEPSKFVSFPKIDSNFYTGSELAFGLIKGLGLTFSSVMYRSRLIQKINLSALVDAHSIIFDRPLLFELLNEGKCALVEEPLILYRCHDYQDSKTGPLNEDNLFALFVSYKNLLRVVWTKSTKNIFYTWSGFQLVDGYKRLGVGKKSPFNNYLSKARDLEIYNDTFYYYYCIGLMKQFLSKIVRIFKKIKG